jgi:Na+-transporting methylmalonyl-CoA/oxaloacetate decarboxylase gamma subunit
MMRNTILTLILLMPLMIFAQGQPAPGTQAEADSLLLAREQEILSEYGFRDSNTLTDVAKKLEIEDLRSWKMALGLEPDNKVLDNMTLRKLAITRIARYWLTNRYLQYNEMSTISEIAFKFSIPVKKFKALLGNHDPLDTSWDNTSLQALGISLDTVQAVKQEFEGDILSYGGSVLIVGVLVVFLALILTSIVISQLVHLNRKSSKENTIKVSGSGQVKSAPKNISSNVIVAAVTALHMHQMDIEERRRMVLTFRRTPTNQWRASAVLSMPNREMTSVRRSQ